MNIACIETFLAVVQTGNLNRAAERLNVTQSTVSARLDALEAGLGQPLLVRARSGAQLTKAGFAFQRHAELMVQTWDLARRRTGLSRGLSGLVSLACQHDLWEGLGARLVAALQAAEPALAVEAWPGETPEIRRWLGSGLVDAALTVELPTGAGLVAREIGRDRLVQVAAPARGGGEPAHLFVDHGADFRRAHALAFPGQEIARLSLASSRWALDHLLAEGGTAYLPWRMAAPAVAAGRLATVAGAPEFGRPVHLVLRAGLAETSAAVGRAAEAAIGGGA